MYEYIRGQLIEITVLKLVIDVNGIGYKLLVPVNYLGKLPQKGENIFLYTSWIVREVSQTLYGFLTQKERDLFELLIAISGVGPKTALVIMGHLELPDLERAVRTNNSLAFVRVPGVGKKTAERLLIDLRGRLDSLDITDPKRLRSSNLQDAFNALIHLGYSQASAEKAIKKATDELSEESDVSTFLRVCLQKLS